MKTGFEVDWISPPKIIEVLQNHEQAHYLKKYKFLHRTSAGKKNLKIGHLPHRNHINSNWSRSEFHLKNWLSLKKLKNIYSQKFLMTVS